MAKLLVEQIEDTEILEEAASDGKKHLYIKGVFMQSELVNRNGRWYPKHIMEKAVEKYTKNYIEKSMAYGELNHSSNVQLDPERYSHLITELKQDGNNWIGKARILVGHPKGDIVKAILENGGRLGVSSRGIGSLTPRNGMKVVGEDYQIRTAADIVSDPSAPDAFVQAIMEQKEWVQNSVGEWVEADYDRTRKILKEASKTELESISLRMFTDFMSKISQ